MRFTEKGRAFVLGMIADCEGAEALLFDTDEIDGGLSLSMHIVDIQEGDRVLDFDGLKVVVSEELEEMLGEVFFDEVDGELMVGEEEVDGGCDCGCGCGNDCDCGGHDDEDKDCECGCGGHEGCKCQ